MIRHVAVFKFKPTFSAELRLAIRFYLEAQKEAA